MIIIRDVPLKVEMEEIILCQGGDLSRAASSRLLELNQELLEKTLAVARPAIIYKEFQVDRIEGKRIYLDAGKFFESKVLTNFLGTETKELTLCAYTVGPEVDSLIDDYKREGQSHASFLLDGIANAVLGSVGRYLIAQVEDYAAGLGLAAGTPMSPGQADWNLEQQQVLFELLPAGKVGITLNENNFMTPMKSATMVMGIGKGLTKRGEGSACDFCKLRTSCPQRKVKEYALKKSRGPS